MTFDGATPAEAAQKKDRWLSENTNIVVRAMRTFPVFANNPRASLGEPTSIEIDYDKAGSVE
jgi:hypothetical protein